MKLTNLLEKNQTLEHHEAFAQDVIAGLSTQPKSIPAKYFYDDTGSELFQKITQHPDYYLTNTEYAILQSMHASLPELIRDEAVDIIELGVGDGHKSKLIIDSFLDQDRQVNYYPIDISEKAMQLLGNNMAATEQFAIHGVIADYFHGLQHIHTISSNKKLVLFLGSNIGNFTHEESAKFLKKIWSILDRGDHLFIGFDLIKDPDILNRAYNDSDGLTSAFNLNLLHRINQELGGNIDLGQFQHYGFYNPIINCMESYLISMATQDVRMAVSDQTFHFEQFEALHLEYSYKYSPAGITQLANKMGFNVAQHFTDANQYFIDALWQVDK